MELLSVISWEKTTVFLYGNSRKRRLFLRRNLLFASVFYLFIPNSQGRNGEITKAKKSGNDCGDEGLNRRSLFIGYEKSSLLKWFPCSYHPRPLS
jgi:hypothetical protein